MLNWGNFLLVIYFIKLGDLVTLENFSSFMQVNVLSCFPFLQKTPSQKVTLTNCRGAVQPAGTNPCLPASVRMLAAGCICLLAFINCWSVRAATKVQDYFTLAKLCALAIIIATGIYQLCRGESRRPWPCVP